MRKRVYLYIVKRHDILVLRHVDFPHLGLQIPGGTIELNEAPINAAAREALEETGLTALDSPRYLGVSVVQSERAEENLLEAWFYQIDVLGHTHNSWLHTEQFASEGKSHVRFELSWLPISQAAELLSTTDCLRLDTVLCPGN